MTMHVSCFTNSYGRFGPRAAIEHIESAGVRHLELAIKTHGVASIFGETPLLTDTSTRSDIDDVRELLARHGVLLSSCNISSGNPLDPQVVTLIRRSSRLHRPWAYHSWSEAAEVSRTIGPGSNSTITCDGSATSAVS